MRKLIAILVTGLLLAVVGCGKPSDSTPVACLEGTGAYLKALAKAPGVVKLRGEALISECLAENQQAGDLATVGTTMVTAAIRLNAEARSEPGNDANLQLGYLLGAAERGADSTNGIHADLIRRLAAAARYSPDNRPLPAVFLSTYREGFDAGRARG
ncbi:MAG TPA: hypothetical protein VN758_09810 [Solirubrobacterales bacterium]|nr:hypothetical protein [Solirubrobacterales bacterium]